MPTSVTPSLHGSWNVAPLCHQILRKSAPLWPEVLVAMEKINREGSATNLPGHELMQILVNYYYCYFMKRDTLLCGIELPYMGRQSLNLNCIIGERRGST